MSFSGGPVVKNPPADAGDMGSISGSRRSLGERNGSPLRYSCLKNPMDRGAWWATVHGVANSQIRLSDFTFTFHFHALEKEVASHSSVLAWRIPGTGEPCGLPSMGSHRVRHDWRDLAAAAAAISFLRCFLPTSLLLFKIVNNISPGQCRTYRLWFSNNVWYIRPPPFFL